MLEIYLYKIHDELTDKKLLGTVTPEEESQLCQIRRKMESNTVNEEFVELYKYKINAYQELLCELKDLKRQLKCCGGR